MFGNGNVALAAEASPTEVQSFTVPTVEPAVITVSDFTTPLDVFRVVAEVMLYATVTRYAAAASAAIGGFLCSM